MSQTTEHTETQEIYIAGHQTSGGKTYHTNPDCRALKQTQHTHKRTIIPLNRRLCKYCDPNTTIDFTNHTDNANNTTCRCCGQALNPDGSCTFCTVYHDIMGEFA